MQSHSQDARLKTGSRTHKNLGGQTLRYLLDPSPIAVFRIRSGSLPDIIPKIYVDAAVDVFDLTRTGPKPTKLEPAPAKPNRMIRTEPDKSNHVATQI